MTRFYLYFEIATRAQSPEMAALLEFPAGVGATRLRMSVRSAGRSVPVRSRDRTALAKRVAAGGVTEARVTAALEPVPLGESGGSITGFEQTLVVSPTSACWHAPADWPTPLSPPAHRECETLRGFEAALRHHGVDAYPNLLVTTFSVEGDHPDPVALYNGAFEALGSFLTADCADRLDPFGGGGVNRYDESARSFDYLVPNLETRLSRNLAGALLLRERLGVLQPLVLGPVPLVGRVAEHVGMRARESRAVGQRTALLRLGEAAVADAEFRRNVAPLFLPPT